MKSKKSLVTTPHFDASPWRPTYMIDGAVTELPGLLGSTRRGWQGAQYEATRGLSGAAVASAIRADIKQAIADGALPPMKFTVKTQRYAGGYAIDVEVTGLLTGVRLISPRYAEAMFRTNRSLAPGSIDRFTPEAVALFANLNAIYNAYNYGVSDAAADYFDRRYNGRVDVSSRLLRQEEIDAVARLGLAPRTDAALEASISEAIYATPELRALLGLHVRAFPTREGLYRLQCVDENSAPPRVIGETVAPLGGILEVLHAWAHELAKKNGRAMPRRGRGR